MTFERWTDRARRAVVLAQEEARMAGRDGIGTGHILLGLIGEGEGCAFRAIVALGAGDLEAARSQVAKILGPGKAPAAGHIPFTPRAKKVCELALREALGLGHNYVGTEHVLLGLLREGEGAGAQALAALGVSADAARAMVLELLRGYAAAEKAGARAAARVKTAEAEIIARLDPLIRPAVVHLRDHGVDTSESCQGGDGHGYPHPVIRFGGGDHAGLQAVWLLEGAGWQVNELVRIWDLNAGSFTAWRVDLESCQRRQDWPAAAGGAHV